MLTCGPPSMNTATPSAKVEDENSCSDDDSSRDEENQTVSFYHHDLLRLICVKSFFIC